MWVNTATGKAYYYGYRDTINLLSQYNFNLDNRIVYGFENEFDAANFDTWATSKSQKTDEAIYSQFFDYQFRPLEKLHLSAGGRKRSSYNIRNVRDRESNFCIQSESIHKV